MCFLAREPWIKLPVYALAQTLGAFLGAGIVFGLYYGEHSPPCHPPLPPSSAWDLLVPGLLMTDSWGLPKPQAHDSLIHSRAQGGGHKGKETSWATVESQAAHPPKTPE